MPAALLLALAAGLPDVRLVGETATGETRLVPLERLPVKSLGELDLVLLQVEGTPPAAPAGGQDLARLELVGGERITGRVAGGAGETLSLALLGEVVLPVDLTAMRSLVFPARIPAGRAEPIEAPAELDRVYRQVGAALDVIDGTLEGFSAEGVVIEGARVGRRTVPWPDVAAVFVEVLGGEAVPAAFEGEPVVVDLADQSRLRGRLQGLSAAGLDLFVGRDTEVALPLSAIAEITRDDGSVAFLSDLQAVREEGFGNPFERPASPAEAFGMVWPHRADRAATGAPLRAGGRTWARGIGMQAPTRVVFPLDGGWRELRGAVAIDDSVAREPAAGSVIFRIHVDGEVAWESAIVTGGDPPLAFPPIQLAGRSELVLEADMADDWNQGDRADWLRMLLVR